MSCFNETHPDRVAALLERQVELLRSARAEPDPGSDLGLLYDTHELVPSDRRALRPLEPVLRQQSHHNAAATRLIAGLVERSRAEQDDFEQLHVATGRLRRRLAGAGRATEVPDGRLARHDEAIAWLRDSGPVLHVGARPGAFLEAARDAGLEAVAAVPDFDAVTRLRAAGLNALTLEPISYLEATAPNSLGGLHVDATSDLDELERIATLAASQIVPGGRIAFAYLPPDEQTNGRRFERGLAGLPPAGELLLTNRPG